MNKDKRTILRKGAPPAELSTPVVETIVDNVEPVETKAPVTILEPYDIGKALGACIDSDLDAGMDKDSVIARIADYQARKGGMQASPLAHYQSRMYRHVKGNKGKSAPVAKALFENAAIAQAFKALWQSPLASPESLNISAPLYKIISVGFNALEDEGHIDIHASAQKAAEKEADLALIERLRAKGYVIESPKA